MLEKGLFLGEYLLKILPQVKGKLKSWQEVLSGLKDNKLKDLALRSLKEKAFHAIGGGAYALLNKKGTKPLLWFIVSFQTISDYLDNLCDEVDIYNEKAFRQLHKALEKALLPTLGHDDYYRFYPLKEDGGYLRLLVEDCQQNLKECLTHEGILPHLFKSVNLYIDLQSLKHLSLGIREERLIKWYKKECPIEDLSWYEFAAACGSTLGIFALLSHGSKSTSEGELDKLQRAYFPWICGLHILLDYLIDAHDDERKGELNFVSYYKDPKKALERMSFFFQESWAKTYELPQKNLHQTILKGLLSLYLSLEKGKKIGTIKRHLLSQGGEEAFFMYHLCLLLRRMKIL